jgi:peptide deformylase
MVREINTYGNPVLNKKCVPCEPRPKGNFLSEVTGDQPYWTDEVLELIKDLKDTAMANAETTLGLAAPQIWWKNTPCPAVFVVRTKDLNENWFFSELINPKIKPSGPTFKSEESCLSVPNYSGFVKRKKNLYVEYQLISGEEIYRVKLFGRLDYNAIVIQHEFDHLLGKLIKK